MQLQPKHPPRRKRRKVRAFANEIRRLQEDGYTCDEIREALADIGIVVSRSTVQREAARQSPMAGLRDSTASTAVMLSSSTESAAVPAPLPRPAETRHVRTARQVAEDFMQTQTDNHLLHNKRTPS